MAASPSEVWAERALQRAVCEALDVLGYRWCHFRPARTERGWRTPLSGSPGFPDVVAVRGGRVLFIELKGERGRVSEAQALWLEALAETPAEVFIWKSGDWPAIEEALR